MIAGRPTIVISYSERHRDRVARPVAQTLESQGIKAVLIGEEPLPPTVDATPTDKVAWFFVHADMAVFLATPDDELVSGEIHTRQNIIDEHRLGLGLPHLRHRLLVFKADGVTFPSNINPVHERLPLDDPQSIARRITEQAMAWQLLPPERDRAFGGPIDSSGENPSRSVAVDTDAGAREQALGAISHASAALNGDAPDTPFLWRAQLAIAGLAATEGSADTLPVHLANRLFRRREDILLRAPERLVLLRTYLRHVRDDNVPVFAWIRGLSRDEGVGLLESIASSDSDAEVQAQAIQLLGAVRPVLPATHVRRIASPLLQHEESGVRGAVVDLIAGRGGRILRPLLDDEQLIEQDAQRVARATALMDLKRYPGRVFDRYMSESAVRVPEVEDGLLGKASRLSKRAVESALRHSRSDVRRLGLRISCARGELPTKIAFELISKDASRRVRLEALQALLDQGVDVSEAVLTEATERRDGDETSGPSTFDQDEAVRRAFWMRQPPNVLREQLEWTSLALEWCYEALGINDKVWTQEHVRRDLREDFIDIKERSRERIRASFVRAGGDVDQADLAVAEEQFERAWGDWIGERLGAFILRRLQCAAIRILVVHGSKQDLPTIRAFTDSGHSELRPDILAFLERFGTAHDVQRIVAIAETVHDDDVRRRAARLALRLAWKKDRPEVLDRLRAISGVERWVIEQLASEPGGLDRAWRLLWAAHHEVRLAAAMTVWGAVRPDVRSALLTQYMGGQHFYNVVKAVDARLYAPEWLAVD